MNLHELELHDVTNIGWLFNLHTYLYSCSAATENIHKYLPPKVHLKIQLKVKTVPYFLCKKPIQEQ